MVIFQVYLVSSPQMISRKPLDTAEAVQIYGLQRIKTYKMQQFAIFYNNMTL